MESESEMDECVTEELLILKTGQDTTLHLHSQQLGHIPQQLFEDPDYQPVKTIYLHDNRMTSLTADIAKLANLVELYLHSNLLSSLPDALCGLPSLETLDVSSNQIAFIPASLCKLQALEKLILSNNKLRCLPTEIGEMRNLQVLEVVNNHLAEIPIQISHCKKLSRLVVDRNNLIWLPRQLCTMDRLEQISATGNRLLYVPLELGEMKSLKCVYVDNNPGLHALPVSLYSQEIGFSSCGVKNFIPADNWRERLHSITIQHSDDELKIIYLPPEIQEVGDRQHCPVPSLLELAMRKVYSHRHEASLDDYMQQLRHTLPSNIIQDLALPTGRCLSCHLPLYKCSFPAVYYCGQSAGTPKERPDYFLGMCCSIRCVRRAAMVSNFPLVYPWRAAFLRSL